MSTYAKKNEKLSHPHPKYPQRAPFTAPPMKYVKSAQKQKFTRYIIIP